MKPSNIIVGLDIGTTKISTIVAEVEDEGEINIIGLGVAPSRGLKKGVVVDIEQTTQSIKQSVTEAEKIADVVIDYVFVGVAGSHISSMNTRSVVAVGGENRDIGQADVQRVLDSAKTFALPPNREIIHVLPRFFAVDEQTGIRDPKGMSGVRLEVDVHIVMGAVTWVQNLMKSCHRADLDVAQIILQPIASATAVLTSDEKELGVCLVDIGGGTTDIAVYTQGAIVHSAVLPVGGLQITNDIAIGLRTPMSKAEDLKVREGCASVELADPSRTIEVPNTGGDGSRSLPLKNLCEITEPRMEEIFNLVKKEIQKSGCYEILPAGTVLTGGTSLMRGARQLAERILGLPVRIGKPLGA
ncbi:MAG: cell division protein FtsA [Candidatus Riflebacteria bacterium]|nr:cell division protein FtsA [Candidatus Riflebacteria bacterium]